MAPPILLEEGHQRTLDQLRHRAYPEHPSLTGLEGARAFADRLGVDQEAPAPLEQVLACGRQLNAAPDQIEQPHTQFRLKRMKLSGNGWLAEVDPPNRRAQSPGIGNGNKGLQVP
jgi:hypothetical protein